MFSFVPIAFAGWLSGKRVGIITAFLILILNYFLLPHIYANLSVAVIQSIPVAFTAVGIGGMTGWFRQLLKKTRRNAGDLEEELISLNNQLRERELIEAKLKKSQERYSSIVDNINEVIFQIDEANKWTFLNPAWSKLTGFSVKESLGTSFINYIHADDREKSNLFFSQTLSKEQTDSKLTIRFLTIQNDFKWIEVHCKQILGQDNKIAGIFGTLRDVTEIIQTEDNLKSRAKFEKLIATISTAFINLPLSKIDQGISAALKVIGMFFNVDRSYLFLCSEDRKTYLKTHEWIGEEINLPLIKYQKRTSKLLNYLENKLTSFETIYIPDVAQLPAEALTVKRILDRGKVKSIVILPLIFSNELIGFLGFDAILKKKEFTAENLQLLKVIADIFANAYQNKKREEKIVSLNQALETRVTQRTEQLEAANNELKNEIVERIKIQNALIESEVRYRTLFESNPYPMWVYDQETLNFLTINDMAVRNYGYSREEFLSMTLKDIRPTSEIPNALEYLSQPQPEINYAGIWKHMKKDGTFIDVEIISHSIHFGDRTARLVLALDVTERIKAEKQLQASLTEKEIMIKEIHHRVKNNLQIISSLLTLQAEFIKDESARGYFNDSQNRVKSMAIIHEKLYQTRDFANIDIKDYVDNLTFSLFRAYNINSNLIDVNVDISNISLDVDTAVPCGLIINELVSNSLKYAFTDERKGKMTIKLIPVEKDQLQLIVSDNGIGLPENFDFRQTQSLGLTLVNILAKQLNGGVEMVNDNGATFIITFRKPYCNGG
ncbi:MAG: PAS domain S-box protein [Ignavibacteriaceae bacterium]|nr:PAS domain S-box protein [Ignavibacteriaceae bacterium]